MEQDQMAKDYEQEEDEDKAEGGVWEAVIARVLVVSADVQIVGIQNLIS
jgi:hypothetical protein